MRAYLAAFLDRRLNCLAGAFNGCTCMNIVNFIGCIVLFSVLGCKDEARPTQSTPPKSKTISDGSHTWSLGAATMNGTNIPLSNITIRVITNQTPK
jgi:hypothetical protein